MHSLPVSRAWQRHSHPANLAMINPGLNGSQPAQGRSQSDQSRWCVGRRWRRRQPWGAGLIRSGGNHWRCGRRRERHGRGQRYRQRTMVDPGGKHARPVSSVMLVAGQLAAGKINLNVDPGAKLDYHALRRVCRHEARRDHDPQDQGKTNGQRQHRLTRLRLPEPNGHGGAVTADGRARQAIAVLEPSPHLLAIITIVVAEQLLQIAFFAGNHEPIDYKHH